EGRCQLRAGVERETGFEPATSTLARWHSTAELLPRRRVDRCAKNIADAKAVVLGDARSPRQPPIKGGGLLSPRPAAGSCYVHDITPYLWTDILPANSVHRPEAAMERPLSKSTPASPPSRRPSAMHGGAPTSVRDPSQDRGAGFVWLLAPHPGRIRACPVSHGGTLGRDEDAALRLDAPGVAPHHARVDLVSRMPGAPPEIYVTDSGTTSGTYVSGMRAQRTVLHDGDLLRVGGAIALVVERDVGTFDGTVVDEGGVVRGPKSRRGW